MPACASVLTVVCLLYWHELRKKWLPDVWSSGFVLGLYTSAS